MCTPAAMDAELCICGEDVQHRETKHRGRPAPRRLSTSLFSSSSQKAIRHKCLTLSLSRLALQAKWSITRYEMLRTSRPGQGRSPTCRHGRVASKDSSDV